VSWYTWVTDPRNWLALTTAFVSGVLCFVFTKLSEKAFEDADALTVGVFVVFGNQFIFERFDAIAMPYGFDGRHVLGMGAAMLTAAGGGLIRNVVVLLVLSARRWPKKYCQDTLIPAARELAISWWRYMGYAGLVALAFVLVRWGLETMNDESQSRSNQIWLLLYLGMPLLSLMIVATIFYHGERGSQKEAAAGGPAAAA
jgi:uncharacterized membrane protein YeiH